MLAISHSNIIQPKDTFVSKPLFNLELLPEEDDANDLIGEMYNDLDIQAETKWTKLQSTWAFDACPMSGELSHHHSVHVPSLFTFAQIVSTVLFQRHYISTKLNANDLLKTYVELADMNITAIELFHMYLDTDDIWLEETETSVKLVILLKLPHFATKRRLSFTPQTVFEAKSFVLDQTYTFSPAFRHHFLDDRVMCVYSISTFHCTPLLPPLTLTEAVAQGCAFDLYFPKLQNSPFRFASSLAAPLQLNLGKTQTNMAGFLLFVIQLENPSAQTTPAGWKTMTPKFLHVSGSMSWPAFPKGVVLPPDDQIEFMWTTFTRSARLKCKHTPSQLPIVGWILKRALVYAHEVRRFYDTRDISPTHVKFKILCVAWQILHLMLEQSEHLYALLVRSFGRACTHRVEWACAHKTISRTNLEAVCTQSPTHAQSFVHSCDVTNMPNVAKELTSKTTFTNCVSRSNVNVWWYICPFHVFQTESAGLKLRLGAAFKANVK